MVEKRIRPNGANAERGAGVLGLASVVARVLFIADQRPLVPVDIAVPTARQTVYRRADRIDPRGSGRATLARRQPSSFSNPRSGMHPDRRSSSSARRS